MTAQKFELVFQKISLSLPLLEAFQGTEVRRYIKRNVLSVSRLPQIR